MVSGGTAPAGQPQGLAYLQLIRAPNVFTAVADVAMGFLVVSAPPRPWWQLCCLAAASSALYMAGMVLNDLFDIEADRRLRPQRPLPAERISLATATRLGYGLLLLGILMAAATGWYAASNDVLGWRSGAIAGVLALSIWLYDGLLKATPLAPLLMGSCRFWNVLLGMSLGAQAQGNDPAVGGFDLFQLSIAAGIGIYIVGVTWFARREAEGSSRLQLSGGLLLMIGGVGLLGAAPQWAPPGKLFELDIQVVWPGLLLLLGFPIARRCLAAIAEPQPHRVQAAVKLSILSLITLDAAVVMLVSPWYWAAAVLALLIPTMLLGRWIYST